MYIVIHQQGHPDRYFPYGAKPDCQDYVCDLQQAQFFDLEIVNGQFVTKPELPKRGVWVPRVVDIRLK